MKIVITLFIFLITSVSISQTGEIGGNVILLENNMKSIAPGISLNLISDGKVISESQTDFDGNYKFKNIPNGNYVLKVTFLGFRDKIINDIRIENDTKVLDFIYPEPCQNSQKICPKGNTKNIVPIVYGFPSKKMVKKANRGKIRLGGCNPNYCEKWHCKEHDIEF